MSDPKQEHDYWNERGGNMDHARDAIAADPAAWDGEVLQKSLALVGNNWYGHVLDLEAHNQSWKVRAQKLWRRIFS